MRILKFLGVFLAAALLIFIAVFGFNFQGLQTLFENRQGLAEGSEWVEKTYSLQGLTEYIGSNPSHVSIASFSVLSPDSSIYYNENTPRSMGTLSIFFLILEYARQVDSGRLDPDSLIRMEEVDRHQLPKKDESAHEDALDALEDDGKISNGQIRLEDLVKTAIRYNDLAMADYLYFLLGPSRITELMIDLDLEQTDIPLPFSGLYIAIQSGLNERTFEERIEELSTLSDSDFNREIINLGRRYMQGEDFRDEVVDRFSENGLNISFMQERDALDIFPKTTASELNRLLFALYSRDLISVAVSEHVLEMMSWPMESVASAADFESYFGLYDNRMGLLNGIDIGTSQYSGDTYVQTVFFDSLPVAFWFHMSSNFMHQDYQQRLMWDPALRNATQQEVSNNR